MDEPQEKTVQRLTASDNTTRTESVGSCAAGRLKHLNQMWLSC